jgi:hypothetical protein
MKRLIFVLFICLLCVNLLLSQTGTGTKIDPYMGTISGPVTWDPSLGAQDHFNNDIPTIYARDIIIASGGTLTILPNGILSFFKFSYSLTIQAGASFWIKPGACVTVKQISNNGFLTIESDAAQVGSASLLMQNAYTGSGSTEVQLYLAGGPASGGGYRWHYVSVPINNIDVIAFNNYEPTPSFNLAQYVEPLATTNNMAGWVTYDAWQYSSNSYLNHNTYDFSTLTLGQGYNFYSAASPVVQLYTGGGSQINISNIDCPVTCNTGSPDTRGWNLIGNPFTSSLDWDYTVANNDIPYVDDAIYFTINNTVSSYVTGSSTTGATGIIPPMQGFFVHTTGASSVPLHTDARTHDPWQMRYKKGTGDYVKSSDTISYFRLNFENQIDKNDLVVRFNRKATASFDKKFDAYKLNKTNGVVSAWTKTGNIDYSINGLPFPETTVEIPVGINVITAGIYKLSSNEINKLDNYSVTLKDILTNITIDLKKGGIMVFNAPAGMTEDRFVLTVTNITTGISDILLPDKKFSIYSSAGIINILSLTEEFNNIPGSVNIYDLNGRRLLQQSNIDWQGKGELKQIPFNSAKQGLYIVEIKAGNRKYIEKVYLAQ